MSIWSVLQSMPALACVSAAWRVEMGDGFEGAAAFLQRTTETESLFPCPNCACRHEVLKFDDGTICAACRCNPQRCPDIDLMHEDTVIWELNREKFSRAIAKAFGLQRKTVTWGLHETWQIGSWSADAVPVVLTIQWDPHEFRHVVAELVARLRCKFILLAPTGRHLDAHSLELLATVGAGFFPLEQNLILLPGGVFQSVRPPSELFAKFSPSAANASDVTPQRAPLPRFALRKGLGVWKLVFEGKEAELKHEQGIFYVAWLLTNPPEQPIHALDLAAKVPEIYREQLALPRITDPTTGRAAPIQSNARIQERSLSLDDAQAMRALLRKEKELEAILDDENESEPVKQEALRELEAIAEFQRQHGRRSQDSAQRAVRAVRQAIVRFHRHLLSAMDSTGSPHPVLRPFALHLEKHLLIPSTRYSGPARARTRGPLAGSFTYESPAAVVWSD